MDLSQYIGLTPHDETKNGSKALTFVNREYSSSQSFNSTEIVDYHSYFYIKSNSNEENIYETIQEEPRTLQIALIIALVILLVIISIFLLWNQHWFFATSDAKPEVIFCFNDTLSCRREFIRNMTRGAWTAYRAYAWGHAALKPVSKSYDNTKYGSYSGATIIGAMSTLWVMGLEEEWAAGRKWIEAEFNPSAINKDVTMFLLIKFFLGGLISAYSLSGDPLFKTKALEMAEILEPLAFHPNTGLAYANFNLKTRQPGRDQRAYLANIGFEQPEFIILASWDNYSNSSWSRRLGQVRQLLADIDKPRGLYMESLDVTTGKWASQTSTLTFKGLDFYYNMIRSYIQKGRSDDEVLQMYATAVESMRSSGMLQTIDPGLVFATDFSVKSNTSKSEMDYYACRAGAMFAIGAKELEKAGSRSGRQTALHWGLAVNLTAFCNRTASSTLTKLLPDIFSKTKTEHSIGFISHEMAETYYTLWRLTKASQYRDGAWTLAQALYRYCRTESGGYTSLRNVNLLPLITYDNQTPAFLSGTLKYLYLIFSETNETVLPDDRWIWNTFGHPLPILKS